MAKKNPPQTNDSKVIEKSVRLSESKLWALQRNYFTTMGINAWEKDVPYYITNNAFIGHQYATLVAQLLKDLANQGKSKQKIYILELGCGTGKFGFYFLKSLSTLMAHQDSSFPFCYIMSDVSEKNIEFCQNNPSLKPYIDAGTMDFALFDVETDKEINLRISGEKYSPSSGTPLIIISNYIFDCIKHDFLSFQNNEFHALNIGMKSRYKTFDQIEVKYLNDLRFDYSTQPINLSEYYTDSKLIHILNEYKAQFIDKQALFPIPLAGINFINNMIELTSGNVFFLIGDKGISVLEHFTMLTDHYRMTYEGCYTFLLNFHLLGEYIKKLNGDTLLTQKANEFQVCLYSVGNYFKDLPNTTLAFQERIEGVGPHEFASLFDSAVQNGYRYSAKAISAFLRLSHWDPDAYAIVHDRLCEIVDSFTVLERLNFKLDIEKIENNIYWMEIDFDINDLLGLLYQKMGDEEKALKFYERSMQIFSTSGSGYLNTALLYDKRKDKEKALLYYRKAYDINKRDLYAKRRMEILEGKTVATLIGPVFRLSIVIVVILLIILLLTK